MDAAREIIVSGIADAIAYDNEGRIETVVDWKSDVAIDAERLNSYHGQLDVYRRQTGARNALLVLMTPER
jgi:exodeoxyribonuclease-5